MKQNNSTELLGHSFLKIYNKSGPPDPSIPQIVAGWLGGWLKFWIFYNILSILESSIFSLNNDISLESFPGCDLPWQVSQMWFFPIGSNESAARKGFPER